MLVEKGSNHSPLVLVVWNLLLGVSIMVIGNVLLAIIKCVLLYSVKARDWKLRGMLFATASSCAGFIHLSIGLCERGFTMDKFIIGVGAINKILKSKKLQWTLLVFQYHFNKIQVPYMFEMSIS